MIEYVATMIATLIEPLKSTPLETESLQGWLKALTKELKRFDPRDFVPASSASFIELRRRLRLYVSLSPNQWLLIREAASQTKRPPDQVHIIVLLEQLELTRKYGIRNMGQPTDAQVISQHIITELRALLQQASSILKDYLGADARGKSREFGYIADLKMRELIKRDYRELTLKIFPSESWKSVVILAGSILEGLLHDLVTRDSTRITNAMASGRAPKRPRSSPPAGPKDLASDAVDDQWLLNDYIEVADDLALLPTGWKVRVQGVLRDFRNYVHPRKEIRAADQITQGEAMQAVGLLLTICEHIETKHP